MKKVYSKADRRQALRLYRKGWGYGRIAEVIGCYPSTIRKWIDAAGVPRHPGPKHDEATRMQAVDAYRLSSHESIQSIAKEYNVHPKTLSRWLREEGVPIRSAAKSSVSRVNILKDIRSGIKKKDIAKKYGCSESWVYRVKSGG